MPEVRKYIVFFLALILQVSSLFSQVDKIKDASDKNKAERDKKGNHGNTGGDYGGSGAGCGGCVADACLSGCLNSLSLGIADLQSAQLRKRSEIPSVISIELMPHFALNPASGWMMMPRARANWGLLSTDFRFYALAEPDRQSGSDIYITYDWQILQLNILITEPVTLRVGSGFMKEDYQGIFFNEHSFGGDIRLDGEKHLICPEFRMAFDYITGNIPRTEVNLRYNYSLGEMKNLRIYAMAGGLYQNYYSSVDLWCIQAGLGFSIR